MGRNVTPLPGTPKPVQRGTVSWTTGTQDVTISAVNLAKAKANLLGSVASSAAAASVMMYFVNSTTIRFIHNVSGNTVQASYEVEEWY